MDSSSRIKNKKPNKAKKYERTRDLELKTCPEGLTPAIVNAPSNLQYPWERAGEYLKSRLGELVAAGDHLGKLTAGERKVMDSYVLGKIAREGYSASQLLSFMQNEWQLTEGQSKNVLNRVLDSLSESNKLYAARAKNIYIERLETIYREAMSKDHFSTALKVLEQMAKAQGFWNDINIVAPVMQFKFGGTPEPGTITVMDTSAFTSHSDEAPATAGEELIATAIEELNKEPF